MVENQAQDSALLLKHSRHRWSALPAFPQLCPGSLETCQETETNQVPFPSFDFTVLSLPVTNPVTKGDAKVSSETVLLKIRVLMSLLLLIQETWGTSLCFICLEALLEIILEMLIGRYEPFLIRAKIFQLHYLLLFLHLHFMHNSNCLGFVFLSVPWEVQQQTKESVNGQGTSFLATLYLTNYKHIVSHLCWKCKDFMQVHTCVFRGLTFFLAVNLSSGILICLANLSVCTPTCMYVCITDINVCANM